ncbi:MULTISPECIES: NAD(+) diphosphatase [Glycomyces]|uniref:NAD(+) diphosphatase n=2 Tax=Glycomyces TaxID=58113 RepID=A0A9X3PPW0_9ACTN|nr:NAD(+) diphosphatase [Glycomyces lechevalierae]MDA1387663.1 NAD(+) diphosphatase [Glycomyces lechevalierae]MDR7337981.1 NAD+ diphosphatase [Glycomyces lechevalierae]
MSHPPLAIDVLDRLGEHRGDDDWLTAAWEQAQIVVCDPENERIAADEDGLHYFDAATAPEGPRIYLGGEQPPVFTVLADLPDGLPGRWIKPDWDRRDLAIAVQAIAIGHWHATYRFHPTTGEPLSPRQAGWELEAATGRPVFPRTDPAVIVLIDDGADRVLLAQHRRYSGAPKTGPAAVRSGRYACIAGFVEPGESAEAAVHREVGEEIGIKIDRLEYVSSQPWPYPRSLMLGYRATADPAQQLVLQDAEIADARWFTRDEVRQMWVETEDSTPSAVRISIARFLIDGWLAEG